MSRTIHVAMGDVVVSEEGTTLVTFVGSCVALCFHDPHAKVAGMAHIMLPQVGENRSSSNPHSPGKYADEAVEVLLKRMREKGAETRRVKARMAGGASMFFHESGARLFNVGEKNTETLKRILKEKGIPVVSEDTGLSRGRKVEFFVGPGELVVNSKKIG